MNKKLVLVVALGLSTAALTSFAQQSQRDSTARGTNPARPTNPTNPYPTNPNNPTPGGPYGSMGSSINFQSFQNLSDAEALAVMACIDSNEIAAARVADKRNNSTQYKSNKGNPGMNNSGKSSGNISEDVEAFAQHMRKDHEKNLKDAMLLAKKLNVTVSTTGEPVRMLKEKGKQDLSKLKSAQGMEFDRTFVNAMVNGHQEVLQIIDAMTGSMTGSASGGTPGSTGSTGGTYGSTSGTSSTSNRSSTYGSQQLSQQVRDFLMQTRVAVAQHLQMAQELQNLVSMGGSSR